MKSLIIVESPNKTKSIKKYLGENYNVVASYGHIRDLPQKELGIDINEDKLSPKYVITKNKVVTNIKNLAKQADEIILAGDPDREGEAISWHLYCLLKGLNKPIRRAEFHEITPSGVKTGIKQLRNIDFNMVNSQQARRLLDRLVGYKISPILWNKMNLNYLSAGRVQSVAVRIVCERVDEINNFEPEEYWKVYANLYNQNEEYFLAELTSKNDENLTLKTKEEAENIMNVVTKNLFNVLSVQRKKDTKKPFPPYITSSFQADMSAKLKINPKKSMEIAQALFEGIDFENNRIGLITYHRTDSVRVSSEFQEKTLEFIKKSFGDQYIPNKPQQYKTKDGSQDAHECIRPTTLELTPKKLKDYLTDEQLKAYKLIYYRFIASQMANAVYDKQIALINNKDYIFRTEGKSLVFDGFEKLYKYISQDEEHKEKENDKTIPSLIDNEILNCKDVKVEQKFTKPPSYYTEATLIRELEKRGIGRPSTYASIINNILKKYITVEGKRVIPTEVGVLVNSVLVDNFPNILDIDFTKNVEDSLDEIAKGNLNWQNYISKFYTEFEKELIAAEENIMNITIKGASKDMSEKVIGKCPECGSDIIENSRAFSCTGYKDGCKFAIWKNNKLLEKYKKKPTKTMMKSLLENEKVLLKGLVSPKTGGKFNCNVKLSKNTNGYWGLKFDFETGSVASSNSNNNNNKSIGKCPECGADIIENSKAFGCSRYKEGCKFAIWKNNKFLEKYKCNMTKKIATDLLNNKTAAVKNLVSPKTGKKFDTELKLEKDSEYWNVKFNFNKE